jgi:hypothetical protein
MENRIIKFRVFDPSTKVMFVPDVVSGDGRNVYATGRDYENGWDCNDCPLMQSTGRKDVKGREIWQGDIMIHPEFDTPVKVNWAGNGYWTLSGWDFMRTDPSLGEIIGNEFEHPDLLNS